MVTEDVRRIAELKHGVDAVKRLDQTPPENYTYPKMFVLADDVEELEIGKVKIE
jgi:hypothetical protein